jgi:hypothetical protein
MDAEKQKGPNKNITILLNTNDKICVIIKGCIIVCELFNNKNTPANMFLSSSSAV